MKMQLVLLEGGCVKVALKEISTKKYVLSVSG
jgi:hypothetical protein